MFGDAVRAVSLVAAAMASDEFNRERMSERARAGWITVTELADTLTRDYGVPFKASHSVAARLVAESARRPGEAPLTLLKEIACAVMGREIDITEARLSEVLSPEYFVRVRTTPGGPAPAQTTAAIAASQQRLAGDMAWIDETVSRLRKAEELLKAATASL
jgi:argininosuccinate lyase